MTRCLRLGIPYVRSLAPNVPSGGQAASTDKWALGTHTRARARDQTRINESPDGETPGRDPHSPVPWLQLIRKRCERSRWFLTVVSCVLI